MYSYDEIKEGIYTIEEGNVRMYLICGREKALLLDTGNGSGDLKHLISGIYAGEILVAHTHAHSDHTGCDHQFETIYANRKEWNSILQDEKNENVILKNITDGMKFDLGGRCIEARMTPGHTEGSVTFLDSENRLLFTGDNVSDRPVFMCLKGADLISYRNSLEWILSMKDSVDVLLGCHGKMEQTFEQVGNILQLLDNLENGKAHEEKVQIYSGDWVLKKEYNAAALYLPL
ncbi:MAG: MBL fold metallo-hydrolase [Anaerovoracaceae bacterium]